MSVKQSVIEFLEENKNCFFSGEHLAKQLGVSRNAVWKAVNKLKEEGYQIEAVTNKGYCLSEQTDILSSGGIKAFVNPPELYVYDSIDSTNDEGKRRAIAGSVNGTLIVANEQTAGKGRRGRAFFSPSDTGVYLSILLKLGLDFSQSVFITTAVSVAVCRAIEKVCKIQCEIKWVNDVYVQGKKVCGILTEAVSDFETGTIDSIIVGIGVNVKTNDFPEDIKQRAASLLKQDYKTGIRNELVAEIYQQVMNVCADLQEKTFMKEYKERSIVIGKNIRYTSNNEWKNAVVLDIDEAGGLVIQSEAEGRKTLNSGEITIRVNE